MQGRSRDQNYAYNIRSHIYVDHVWKLLDLYARQYRLLILKATLVSLKLMLLVV